MNTGGITMYTTDDFNKFVSAVQSLINDIKSYHLDGGKYRLEDFDLRTMDGDVFRIPVENSDFIEMWGAVQDAYKKYLNGGESEFFFDVYWNNTLEHAAYYDNAVLWIEFKNETIIYTLS